MNEKPADLECQRSGFDIPNDIAYLNAAYMGPLSHEVLAAGRKGLERKARPWTITSPDFFDEVDEVRSLFSRLNGVDAEGVAVVPAVSYGVAIAARNLEVGEGRTVVMLADQFPSNVYAWHDLVDRTGGETVAVQRPADEDWTPAVLDRIDERTAVVSLPNCHWTDGSLLDLALIGERARAVGAALVVDGIQSIGAMPFDAAAIRPDFVVTTTYKWLLGPYSVGFLWCAPHRREGIPLEHSWITREGARDFAHLIDYRRQLRRGAARYDVGETSNFALMGAVKAALSQTLRWEVQNIAAHTSRLTRSIARKAAELGLHTAPEGLRAPHLLGVRLAGADPEVVAASLREANVHVSVRGDSVRVSPHVYNDEADVDRFIEALAKSAG